MEEVPFYYQPADPVHNLRVRVTIRQVRGKYDGRRGSKGAAGGDGAAADDSNASLRSDAGEGRQWSAEFGWQEKELGPREVRRYWPQSGGDAAASPRSPRSPRSPQRRAEELVAAAEARYRAQLAAEAEAGKSPFDVLYAEKAGGGAGGLRDTELEEGGEGSESVKLFTYVDKDGFVPCSELRRKLSTSDMPPTALSTEVLSMRGVVAPGQQAAKAAHAGGVPSARHLRKATGCKSFFIMAAVDMDGDTIEQLRDGDGAGGRGRGTRPRGVRRSAASTKPIYEKTLCCVRWFPQGVLSVQPGFSDDVGDDERAAAAAAAAAAADGSVAAFEASAALPPRIHSFTFTTPAGSTYEYTVENASELADMDDEAKLLRADEAAAAEEAARWRLLTGTAFGGTPPPGRTRVFLNGEIVSAANFEGERLYTKYEVVLPQEGGWCWAEEQPTSAATGSGTPGERGGGAMVDGRGPTPQRTHRGFTSRRTVRGISQQAAIRYTTAAGYHHGEVGPDADGVYTEPTDTKEPVAHFGLPLELEMLRSNHNAADPMQGARTPQLFLQVCSRDSWGRHRVEGFGFLSIPAAPGVYEEVVHTWRLLPSVRDKLGHFLIGGVGQIDDLQSAAIANSHTGPFLSKHGTRTESAGAVRVRMNIMHQVQKPEALRPKPKPRMRRAAKDIIARLKNDGRIGRKTALKKTYKEVAHLVNSLKTYNKPLLHDPSQPAYEEQTAALAPSPSRTAMRERGLGRSSSRRSLSPNRRSAVGTPTAGAARRAARKQATSSTPAANT